MTIAIFAGTGTLSASTRRRVLRYMSRLKARLGGVDVLCLRMSSLSGNAGRTHFGAHLALCLAVRRDSQSVRWYEALPVQRALY